MKKVVLKVDLYDDRTKQKAMKTVSGLSGVESVSVDMKDKKVTLVGEIDPVHAAGKLRKLCPHAEMVSVGPAKEDKKPDDNYSTYVSDPPTVYEAYPLYYQMMRPPLYNQYYYARSVEENPNGCVIC